jgi:hypothetical protein
MYRKASVHSITLSTRPGKGSGNVTPSVLAAWDLTISSTLVICRTGSFPGFAPPGRLHKVVVERGNDGDFCDYFRDAFISVTITNETT